MVNFLIVVDVRARGIINKRHEGYATKPTSSSTRMSSSEFHYGITVSTSPAESIGARARADGQCRSRRPVHISIKAHKALRAVREGASDCRGPFSTRRRVSCRSPGSTVSRHPIIFTQPVHLGFCAGMRTVCAWRGVISPLRDWRAERRSIQPGLFWVIVIRFFVSVSTVGRTLARPRPSRHAVSPLTWVGVLLRCLIGTYGSTQISARR